MARPVLPEHDPAAVDPGPRPEPLAADGTPAGHGRARRARVSAAAAATVVLTDVVVAFGFVMGFNQLGTQSPIDALLPVALFSVGLGGVLTLVASVLGAASAPDDGDGDAAVGPATLAPATLDTATAAFGIGVMALAAVGWRWGVTTQAGLVGAYGITLLVQAERAVVLTARDDARRPPAYRLLLLVPEAVLFIGFAWAALADAGIRPFT